MTAGFVDFEITWRADVFKDAPQSSSAADFGTVGINFRAGDTHQAWGAGRQRITKDGRVRGIWLGTLLVNPGVHAEIDALVIGELVVGRGADVTITGKVTGRVRNEGGRVAVASR